MAATKPAKQYARMIVDYLKKLPDGFADDPLDVQDALALNDDEFKLGVDWCIERGIIKLEQASETLDDWDAVPAAKAAESEGAKENAPAENSKLDEEELDKAETGEMQAAVA